MSPMKRKRSQTNGQCDTSKTSPDHTQQFYETVNKKHELEHGQQILNGQEHKIRRSNIDRSPRSFVDLSRDLAADADKNW
eukprot:TRINITY_DN13201_c0_g1_i1.p1 TRINITY_DN13201_c0_g1~~TRINITY_DN13201_c0_g1_i1.p1  ORF type:complete len:80 (-),score=9.63 TRINITY_DN13201_c0_g1_i1:67-306(-)